MSISIKTEVFPYRLRLQEKQPGELFIMISNNFSEPKTLSMTLDLPEEVAFDKVGLRRGMEKKLDVLKPGETKSIRLPLFATNHADYGLYSGKLIVLEHAKNYDYVLHKYSKELNFRVSE